MFRFRRYRVFLAFAFITVFALYQFGSSSASWRDVATNAGQSQGVKEDKPQFNGKPRPEVAEERPEVAKETKKFEAQVPTAKISPVLETPPAVAPVSRPVDHPPPAPSKTPDTEPTPVGVSGPENDGALPSGSSEELVEGGQGRLEVTPLPSTVEVIHWKKLSEHFPVPTGSIIKLPAGAPKSIPKIQYSFKQESASAKADRESKLETIKRVFKRSWDGYRKFAWLQDELKPVSGTFRNPFASWGATLVDALDTLWIMGLKDEFEEAVKAVDQIDFTTTPRPDIPLFETTIRYLGGLIAAYDLSGEKHKNLLDKAVELAEVLIGAFDTPNRMPQTYYYWRPTFSTQPHRASNRVVMAEIGSLSVEFTRLAQVTGDDKYYDAIARITDAFEEFQNKTRLPGMWPVYLDVSGCKKVDWTPQAETPLQAPLDSLKDILLKSGEEEPTTTTEALSPGGNKYIPLDLPPPLVMTPNGVNPTWVPNKEESLGPGEAINWGLPAVQKRQLDEPEASTAGATAAGATAAEATAASVATQSTSSASPSALSSHPECEDQGFMSASEYSLEEYTLGGMSDSTYEYLPKQYLLLGGLVEKYRDMFERSMDVVKENLIFRPMLPNGDDILFSGKLSVPVTPPEKGNGELEGENAHLTCFAGGMFGMGAKIFDRPEDLEIAKKLTEGCVWSYNMTSTGIMPEAFIAVPCESTKSCEWNETKYWEVLDPNAESRLASYKEQVETYNEQYSSASAWYEEELAQMTSPPVSTATDAIEAKATPTVVADLLDKRQLTDPEDATPDKGPAQSHGSVMGGEEEEAEGPPTRVRLESSAEPSPTLPTFPVIYSPRPPLSHEEFAKNRIQEERLPPGVTSIKARNYILRPEAIESVWYMYRITGDPHWRDVGWQMFEAVNRHTAAEYGNSAIDDVTKTAPDLNDEMESFWLAETMKYFYLLFADESLVSLDDWVLNTEAHPFKRPT